MRAGASARRKRQLDRATLRSAGRGDLNFAGTKRMGGEVREAGPAPVARRALEGRTPGGQRPLADFGLRRYGLPGRAKLRSRALRGVQRLNSGATRGNERQGSNRGREAAAAPARIKALKAEPQERYRDETSPERCRGA